MDFNDKRFGGNPHSDKDRTVPPDENYYSGNGFDFSSFRRENRNADYGLNPADEYSPNRRRIIIRRTLLRIFTKISAAVHRTALMKNTIQVKTGIPKDTADRILQMIFTAVLNAGEF